METLIDVLALAAVWVIAFSLGWRAREKHAEKVLNKFLEQVEEEEQQQDNSLIKIEIERHNDRFFVYNMEDKSFMAQGDTKKELENALGNRYPGKRFAAAPENLAKVGLK